MSENVSSLTRSWKTVTSWDVFWKEAKLCTLLLFILYFQIQTGELDCQGQFRHSKVFGLSNIGISSSTWSWKNGSFVRKQAGLVQFLLDHPQLVFSSLLPSHTTVSQCVLPYHSHTSHISNLLHLKPTKVSTLFRWWPCGQICDPGNFLVVWLCFLMSQSLSLNSWNLWSFVEIRQF